MNATQLNRGRNLALLGADGLKIEAKYRTAEELTYALEYARSHKGSKTLIETIEREIRRKEQGHADKHPTHA
jgi:hypothetical protein